MQTIVGPYINAMDQSWCPDHFVCNTCEEQFVDGKFLRHQDKPYCKTCYGDVTSTNCGKCGEFIEGEVFEALGQRFQ